MILEDRPKLRGFLLLALVLFAVVSAVAAIDLFSRLGVHHPNLTGIVVLSIFTVIFAIGWMFNRKRTP